MTIQRAHSNATCLQPTVFHKKTLGPHRQERLVYPVDNLKREAEEI